MEDPEHYYPSAHSTYGSSTTSFLGRQSEVRTREVEDVRYDINRQSPFTPQYLTSTTFRPNHGPLFSSYKRKNTSVFQNSGPNSAVSPLGGWHPSGPDYMAPNSSITANKTLCNPPWQYQQSAGTSIAHQRALMHNAAIIEDARKLRDIPLVEYSPQLVGRYSHGERTGRVTEFQDTSIDQPLQVPYVPSGPSLGNSSIHSMSPVSLTGSDSMISQGSNWMLEPGNVLQKQQRCFHCTLWPETKMWPCGCSACSKCGSSVMQALARRSCRGEEMLIGAFGEPCPNCFEPVTNILSLESSPECYSDEVKQYSNSLTSLDKLSNTTNAASSTTVSNLERSIASCPNAEERVGRVPFVELGTYMAVCDPERQQTVTPLEAGVVKIENIPYNLTENILLEFLGNNIGLLPEECGGGVHIIMDRTTGKTMDCFLEFISPDMAQRFINHRMSNSRRCVLGGRHVTMELVDPRVLMKWLFPKVKGASWTRAGTLLREPAESPSKVEILSREELVMIVSHARTPHRSPFSRKCLQRPYESLSSIMLKFPWYETSLYTLRQRNYIFKAVYDAIDLLIKHIKRGRTAPNLDNDLLRKLYRIALRCPGFTDKQKSDIIAVSDLSSNGFNARPDPRKRGTLDGVFSALTIAKGTDEGTIELISKLIAARFPNTPLSSSPSFPAQFEDASLKFCSQDAAIGFPTTPKLQDRPSISKRDIECELDENLTLKEAARVEWAMVNKVLGRYFGNAPQF